jgi:signal transduction histidine kinase/HD-like signal output (HDOD) protein
MDAQVPDKRSELILQQLDQLPTLPAVAVRVLELTSNERTHAREVVRLIESDPALTTRILRIVHRADGGVRSDLNSIERAVVLLGFEAVRNAVLAVSVFETFGPASDVTSPARRFSREEFWKHCVAVACCSELIVEQLRAQASASIGVEASDAFIAGLLHDLGKVAIDAALPKSFARVVEAAELLRGDFADIERSVIGLDHMVVGKRLAERWLLPANLRDAIWLHGQTPTALPANVRNPKLVNIVSLADVIVRQQHLGYSGNYAYPVPVPALLGAVGLSLKQLDDIAGQLVSRIEPRAKSLGLGESTSEALYRQALQRANIELSRVSDQLAAKNRRLGVRAKFFEALSAFHGELRPDAPVSSVLFAIAQTACGVLDCPSAAAFTLAANGTNAEVLLVSRDGDVLQRGIVERNDNATLLPMAAGDGPIHPAGIEMEWLGGSVAPRLGGSRLYWIALYADGAVIGGVVWGAEPDEANRQASQFNELIAMAGGWALALRTCQIREESRLLNEQLVEANRRLQSAQDEIMRAKMLSSVSEMAAGAAHEMNNPLAVICGRAELLAKQLQDPRLAQSANLIREQGERLSGIITELMDFAKPSPPRPTSADLAELIDHALADLRRDPETQSRAIEVTLSMLPNIHADIEQITAAIREVLVNAIQATQPDVGSIEIHAAHDRVGGHVVLNITDNGAGMDERTLQRAFDPFYSARQAGRRRGMGLAKALRWVEGSGGSIKLESRIGTGTRVVMLLPTSSNPPGSVEQPARPTENRHLA